MNKTKSSIILKPVDSESFNNLFGDEMLQTPFWGRIKSLFGWNPLYFQLTYEEKPVFILVLIRRLGPLFSLAYLPYPPFPDAPIEGREVFLENFSGELKKYLPREVRFIRYDLAWSSPDPREILLKKRGNLKKGAIDIQPSSTVLLNILAPEEEILKQMKRKCRYNIGLAKKKGVVIRNKGTDEKALELWYRMYEETAKRDKIVLHSLEYYKEIFKASGKGVEIILLIAEVEKDPVAGIVVGITGKKATYLYGASTGKHRNLMPNHALQWAGITLAREKGCETYDFFGIPRVEDPSHPMFGLYRFKTGFGGEIIHRPGCYDSPLSPFLYAIYTIMERGRRFYYKKIRKR